MVALRKPTRTPPRRPPPELPPAGPVRAQDYEAHLIERAPWHDGYVLDAGGNPQPRGEPRLPEKQLADGSSRPVTHTTAEAEYALHGFWDQEEERRMHQLAAGRVTVQAKRAARVVQLRHDGQRVLELFMVEPDLFSGREQEAILMFFRDLLSYGVIARKLGLARQTVINFVKRVRAKLAARR
jgi:DNA-binding CsgD family transcriptional regulator